MKRLTLQCSVSEHPFWVSAPGVGTFLENGLGDAVPELILVLLHAQYLSHPSPDPRGRFHVFLTPAISST